MLIATVLLVIGIILAVALLNAIAGLPDISDRQSSRVIEDGADSKLGGLLKGALAANDGLNGVYEIPRGLDAFAARASLARLAERSIDTQYYMWHQDIVGRSLVFELLDAADRGVRVRMLIDDMYGSDGQDTWLALDAHPNIEVRLFAPYSRKQPKYLQFLTRFKDVNARMHTKTFTFDNQATIVGGRNIGDEYFDADPKLAFADNDVLAVGPAVQEVSDNFDDYWNGGYAYPVSTLLPPATADDLQKLRDGKADFLARPEPKAYYKAVSDGDLANALRNGTAQFRWGPGTIVHDAWWKRDQDHEDWHERLLITQLKPVFEKAEKEIILISPYFVPGRDSADAFCALSRRGVSVKILTNSLASNDVVAVHAGYSKYREDLLRCGVELFELDEQIKTEERKSFAWLPNLSKSSLHAKSMVVDRERMFVGSFNYDQRSLYLNTEIGLVFDQPEIAEKAAENFNAGIEKVAFRVSLVTSDSGKETLQWRSQAGGKSVEYDSEPYVGPGTKAAVWFMRLLPVDWLL